jgi:hypothetical protein
VRPSPVLTAALLSGALALTASGQCIIDDQATLTIGPPIVTFSTPTIADYDATEIVYHSTVSVVVDGRGNRTWSVCASAMTPDLGTSSGVVKPLEDLQWQADGGIWIPLSTVPQVIATGRGDATVLVQMRMLLDWGADPPGSFGTTVRVLVAR